MRYLLCILSLASLTLAQIETRDVARGDDTQAFYEKLGFEVRRSAESRPTWIAKRGPNEIHFVQQVDNRVAPKAVAFSVTDLEGMHRELTKVGLRVARHGGTSGLPPSLRLEDPDQHPIWIRTPADAARTLPRPGELNDHVLAVMATYPARGQHPYFWPKSGSWPGNARDLIYGNDVVAKGDPQGRCFCCGLTFEVFLAAWQRWANLEARPWKIAGRTVDGVRKLQKEWFGSKEDPSCVFTAVVGNKLGTRIEDFERALPGDFVQLWRQDGSGHSVVFKSWLRSGAKITGLRYWSTQKSTQGIGENEERFGSGRKDLDPNRFWLVRVGLD